MKNNRKKWICWMLCAVLMLTAGCAPKQQDLAESTISQASEPSAEPETVPSTEPETEPSTEAETEPSTEPPVVLHSGLREDGSFSAGTLFIGDSMTHILVSDYLTPHNLIGDAKYTAKYGAHITAFFGDVTMEYNAYGKCAFPPEFEGKKYDEAAAMMGEDATAIYMMWGTNYTWNAYADAYIEVTDYLLEVCPNATVYLQLIPWGYPEFVKFETVNGWIQEAYDHYQQLGEPRVCLIDTFTAIGKNHDSGCIHLNEKGNENWYNAIVAYAQENGIPE